MSTQTSPTTMRILPIGDLVPDPEQPRRTGMDDDALAGMTRSVASIGIIQTLRVRADGNGKYLITTGERRYRAALSAGLLEVPVIIDDELTEAQRLEIQLAENMLRADLAPRERAAGLAKFVALHPNQQSAAEQLGITKGHLSQLLELNDLAPEVEALTTSKITRDATTLAMVNQLMKKAPDAGKALLAQAQEDGKLPRKAVVAALAPHRRPRKKKTEEDGQGDAGGSTPAAAEGNGVQGAAAAPTSPPPLASATPAASSGDMFAGGEQKEAADERPTVRAPSRAKLKRVCQMLKFDEDTDPAVVIEAIVDQFLTGNPAGKLAA